jgi:GTP-binding protein
MSQLPLVAVVGEPNVGKSTLLNIIAGRRLAVTSAIAGTTRDRQYLDTSWNGVDFTLVDTAGVTFGLHDELEAALDEQIEIAISHADLIVFVVDFKAKEQLDRKTILKFRKLKQPTVLVINKVDSPLKIEEAEAQFAELGIKPMFTVSSVTGRGLGDLLDYITHWLTEHKPQTARAEVETGIAVSIVGKPNVGKSSILNRILGEKRVVVSSIPGTTRTAIDTHTTIAGRPYTFIDTAGLKRKEHRQAVPDIYSGFQTFRAIRRSDVCLFVIDASEPLAKQDQHIAREIIELHKGVVIVANKMDAYDGDEERLRDYISMHFPYLWYAPLVFVSAETGLGLEEALAKIPEIYERRQKTIPQEELDKLLAKTLRDNEPKLLRDQRKPKVLGLTQIATNPPLFELFVNYPAAISEQYRKYVQKAIVQSLDFWGTPITLNIRGKDRS